MNILQICPPPVRRSHFTLGNPKKDFSTLFSYTHTRLTALYFHILQIIYVSSEENE